MPVIDPSQIDPVRGSALPVGLREAMEGRTQWSVGEAGGLSQFGANLVELAPGAASALRHWHEQQDEFAVVISGRPSLMDDRGEHPLNPGDMLAFPAGDPNGHHIVNRSDTPARFVVVGTNTPTETGHYPDHDLIIDIDGTGYRLSRTDGTPVEGETE